jgi:NAD(P)-dependent dehydrogenase (short-subunit alcohol dehydrogenase family)
MTDMPNNLEGKIAVVTGVSHQGQIGETVAKALADRGAALAICARTRSSVEARAADLRQAGARVLAVATSLTEESGAKQLIEATIKEYGRIRHPGEPGRRSYPL